MYKFLKLLLKKIESLAQSFERAGTKATEDEAKFINKNGKSYEIKNQKRFM